jgi:hypothetical protein
MRVSVLHPRTHPSGHTRTLFVHLDSHIYSGYLMHRPEQQAYTYTNAQTYTLTYIHIQIKIHRLAYNVCSFNWRMALLVTGALPFMIAGTIIYYQVCVCYRSS